jgi:hypothetical protein
LLPIARTNATAVEDGGRYTPPDELLVDIVSVRCGSADRIDAIFNCTKVVVTSNGRPLTALLYAAKPETFRGALGAEWSAQVVTATFDAANLSDGFSVDFTTDDGIGRTWTVPAADLDGNLFLRIDPISGATSAARVQLALNVERWRRPETRPLRKLRRNNRHHLLRAYRGFGGGLAAVSSAASTE